MAGEKDREKIIGNMTPTLNDGDYVFVTVKNPEIIERGVAICEFQEAEGYTMILKKEDADRLNLKYEFISSWITIKIHSDLEAVGLTAHFSTLLAKEGISCNVVAGYFHDHIFVSKTDGQRAIKVLSSSID